MDTETHLSRPQANGHMPRLTVLLVEDHPRAALALSLLLTLAGHEVRIAEDGTAALLTVEADNPDVVLLNLGLRGMDGYELAGHLGRRTKAKRPLLIALSNFNGSLNHQLSREAGIDLHLLKPVDPVHLRLVLQRFHQVLYG